MSTPSSDVERTEALRSARLALLAAQRAREDAAVHVARARALGATWAEVGEALGVAHQTAHERFGASSRRLARLSGRAETPSEPALRLSQRDAETVAEGRVARFDDARHQDDHEPMRPARPDGHPAAGGDPERASAADGARRRRSAGDAPLGPAGEPGSGGTAGRRVRRSA